MFLNLTVLTVGKSSFVTTKLVVDVWEVCVFDNATVVRIGETGGSGLDLYWMNN